MLSDLRHLTPIFNKVPLFCRSNIVSYSIERLLFAVTLNQILLTSMPRALVTKSCKQQLLTLINIMPPEATMTTKIRQ